MYCQHMACGGSRLRELAFLMRRRDALSIDSTPILCVFTLLDNTAISPISPSRIVLQICKLLLDPVLHCTVGCTQEALLCIYILVTKHKQEAVFSVASVLPLVTLVRILLVNARQALYLHFIPS